MTEEKMWNVASGRAPSEALKAARNAAIVAFHAVSQSIPETAKAFNLNRRFVAGIIDIATDRKNRLS